MNADYVDPVDGFKNKINYDSVAENVDGNKTIIFRKVTPEMWSVMKIYGKQPTSYGITVREKGVSKEWIYKYDEELLIIEIFVSSSNHEDAMDRMLKDASATTMNVIPFKKCPYNLGDINVSIIDDDYYRILWTHFNIYYSVKYTGNNLNIEKLCKEIQNDSFHSIVDDIDNYRPQFDEVIVSSPTIKVGEDVTVYIVPEYGKVFKDSKKDPLSNLRLEKKWSGEVLSLEKETGFFFRLKGVKEGIEKVTFILADMDALVCSKHEVVISVEK